VGTDKNLVIYLDQPFNFKDLVPDILLGSGTSCEITGPANVTVTQGASLSFNIQSNAPSPIISLEAASYEITSKITTTNLPITLTSPNGVASFSWNTGSTPTTPTGSYIAVFQAKVVTAGAPDQVSQLPVMINVVPPGYTLTINATNGSVTKNPDKAAYNLSPVETVQLTAVPASGYYFTGWGGALSGTSNPTSIQMNGSKTVTASFAVIPPQTYSLAIYASGAGTVAKNPDNTSYSSGEQVTLTATPSSGATFSGWSGNLTGSTNPTTITMDGNKSVTATFTSSTPPPSGGALDRIAYADWYGLQTDNYSAGQMKRYLLPITTLSTSQNVKRIKVMIAGLINGGDVGIKLISPSGTSWTSDANGTSDETIELRAQSSWFPNYSANYIEWGDWYLEITGHMSSSIRIWWNYFL
jgi:uncharacterized repeat protein (TIGR02543 family)